MPLSAECCQGLEVLFPHLAGVVAERAEVRSGLVCIWVRPRADGAPCPRCGTWCTRVHGHYTRRLADAPAGGRRVVCWLRVRVLCCVSAGCAVKTFAEQPAPLASRYARRTPLLAGQLAAVAAALAGRAGSRLARAVLAVEVSRHGLVRMLMAPPDAAAGLVRVLGIDDFALRRGCEYATLLVDMETGRPVDVLPDREQATVEQWLRAHPGAEVICRDRGGAYAAAARAAAPGAVQVADRWHLWDNLRGHVRAAAARHRACLAPAPAPAPAVPPDPEAVIRARHRQVHELRAAGATLAQAAAAAGLGKSVTGRYWRAAGPGELLAAAADSALDPHKPYLRRRWEQGGTTIAGLHREITAAGYRGVYMTTWRYLSVLRLAAPARPPAPPTARQAASWILTRPQDLPPGKAADLAAIRGRCPELDALAGHVAAFAAMLTGRHPGHLDGWLERAEADPAQPELHTFATGIRKDYDAVRNALTLPWSSGRVEGLNTRTKLLKRQMYGRAAFPLLRKRILLTSTNPQP